ncbi:heterokaryon incompatibility protein-domain-containing protein [Daldinia eschscholtzii]|nr:heterokaryon incompatibility protein-domain-containing protein [Daldinia eschscholtzii]
MRLLNTNTLEVVEFTQTIPRYAILSHMWEYDELLFQDIKDGHASLRQGYAKVAGCCRQAIKDGYEWVWIDTCCIDKSSSAELSEAINSMYRWYADSCVCYAYLSDVGTGNVKGSKFILDPSDLCRIDPGDDTQLTSVGPTTTFSARSEGYFKESRWFTRGWTLQELIAPRRIKFYSDEWVELGTKTNLREIITKVTGISEDVLLGYTALSDITVALKMSWAANRSTTREEDMAYCLMGLFDINMPLLYGEGTKAFKRLQEEIMHRYEDYTILLCNGLNWDIFLADSPADFSGQIMHDPYWTFDPKVNVRDDHSIEMDLRKLHNQIELPIGASSIFEDSSHAAMSLTSRGVHVALLCLKSAHNRFSSAWTRCWYDDDSGPLFIFLRICRPTGTIAHYRQPQLFYLRQSDMAKVQGEGDPVWREIYLETRHTSIAPLSHSWTTIELHFPQQPEVTAFCHSHIFAVGLPTTTYENERIIRIMNRWKTWATPLLKFPVVVALTLPRREKDTHYVFLVGNLNEHHWCLVMHEVSQQVPDEEYMDSVLRIWNSKDIAKPEVAWRLTKNITIPLPEGEMLSISQEFNGYNDITIQVSIDKIDMGHLVRKETRDVSSQPIQVPQSNPGALDGLMVNGPGGEEKVIFDPKSALRRKKRRMSEMTKMTTRPVKHQRLS